MLSNSDNSRGERLEGVFLGPPSMPLPRRWWRGLSALQVRRVVHRELYGNPRIMPARHEKGYVRIYLGRGHPYADRNGCSTLHRWLMSRHLGRRLATWEHVHHRNGDKATTRLEDLELLEAVEHGQWHYGRHFRRQGSRMEWVSCGAEYSEQELIAMSQETAYA